MSEQQDFYVNIVRKTYLSIRAEKGLIPNLRDVHDAAMFARHDVILKAAIDFYSENFYSRELRRLEAIPIIDEKDAEICGVTVNLNIDVTAQILNFFAFSYFDEGGWPINAAQCNLIEVVWEVEP